MDGFKVQYRHYKNGAWTAWDANEVEVGFNVREYLFTDLDNGQYQARVLATADGDLNCDGDTDDHITDPPGTEPEDIIWPYGAEGPVDGMASSPQSHTLVEGTTAPGQITDYEVKIGSGKITLSWEPPDDGGSLIYGYTVWLGWYTSTNLQLWEEAHKRPNPDWVGHQVGITDHHCIISGSGNNSNQNIRTCTSLLNHEFTGLTRGERYTVSVRAHNANGTSYTQLGLSHVVE